MKLLTNLIPIAFLFFGFVTETNVYASTDTTVISTGYGATEKEALSSAIQNAIESAKGLLLLSTSTIENTKLSSDEITTSREGYAKGFKKISSVSIPSLGGMYKVTARVLVSVEKSLLTSNSSEDSIVILLGSLATKSDRIKEATTFIAKWIKAHKGEYGYVISSIKESNRDDYIDITYKPINNTAFKATLTKLIDRLNTFSNKKYVCQFVDFEVEQSLTRTMCRAENWDKASVTLSYDCHSTFGHSEFIRLIPSYGEPIIIK